MKRTLLPLLVLLITARPGLCANVSFHTVKFPMSPGRLVKAELTLNDDHRAVEVEPTKGAKVKVPYEKIEKVAYEYTLQVMGGKEHWLKIDYNDADGHKVLLLQMSGHDYIKILDAVKAHTGFDAEVLGNADRGPK